MAEVGAALAEKKKSDWSQQEHILTSMEVLSA